MSARDDAIEAGAAVLVGGTNYIMSGDAGVAGTMNRLTATFVVDAVEPIIRADERERMADLARKVQGGGIRDYEAEVRERIAQEVRDMNPWMVLGYSNHPDEKLAGRVIAEVAARIARGGAQ